MKVPEIIVGLLPCCSDNSQQLESLTNWLNFNQADQQNLVVIVSATSGIVFKIKRTHTEVSPDDMQRINKQKFKEQRRHNQ